MAKEEAKTVTLRSGRVSKAPVRYDTSSSDAPKKVKSAPVAGKKSKAGKDSSKTKAATKKKVAAKAQKKQKDTKASATKSKKAAKTKKTDKSPKQLYKAKKPGSNEAVIPDVSSQLSKAQRDALESMNVADLKRVLKANDCISTGTKDELRARVAWFVKNGVPERCPACFGGHLKLDVYGGYFCPGSYDDDHLVPCSYTTNSPKTRPWVTEANSAI